MSPNDVMTARPTSAASLTFNAAPKLRVLAPSRSSTNLKPVLSAGRTPLPYRGRTREKSSPQPGEVDTNLSAIDVENILREKVKKNYAKLLQGFRSYDINRIDAVSKGEFRRVLEAFAMSLSTDQFEAVVAKVPTDRLGALLYVDFLDKFYGKEKAARSDFIEANLRYVATPQKAPNEVNMDQVEKQLQEKIRSNAKDFMKSFHLFDYNRDGRIQRFDFRKVLDNNAIKLNDQQFEKLWMRYDFHHTGTMEYKDFLRKMGAKIIEPNHAMSRQPNLRVAPHQKNESVSPLKHLNIDQLEREFRNMMRTNYVNVKRAMNACDRHGDGFISLEDLRAVLSAFTIPMSEQLFHQLMERAQIKASGKVCWGTVLSKFQDPQSGGNGQTLPIKNSHKYFPVRESEAEPSGDELWALLDRHVVSAYGSFKNAFLQMDDQHTGRITRKDIKKVLQNFKVKLTKKQMTKLMKRLDPESTNSINYLQFLAIFEPKETEDGHKWLNSEHRYNDQLKPAILAWDTVEEILRDKLSENWSYIAPKLAGYDPLRTAKINKKLLRKVITANGIPVSDEHFNFMMSRMEDLEGDKINYVEWLAKIGVDVKPGDLTGLSTQIYNQHNVEMDRRYNDHADRQAQTDEAILERTRFMSAEEVLIRMRDRFSQHKKNIREAFNSIDSKKTGKVSKRQLKKVLVAQGMLLDDSTFNELCDLIGLTNGQIDYYKFLSTFDDPRQESDVVQEYKLGGNHRVNKHRGDDFGMTADLAEQKLRSKLRENFADLRGAFYKFDADHNGLVSRKDFQRMLDSFMIIMPDDEFSRLCQRFGLNGKNKISYQDFLARFQLQDTPEGHKWLISDHKFNPVQDTPNLTAEQAHDLIVKKAHSNWKDLSKAFVTLDTKRDGLITKNELREVLHRFIIPITESEFNRLWKSYDTSGHGSLSHSAFLSHLGVNFAPGDDAGVSRNIVEGSLAAMDEHHANMVMKHEQQTYNQAMTVWNFSVDQIFTQLRDRIRESYQDFYKAFRKYDVDKSGRLKQAHIQKALVKLSYFLSDAQFSQLIEKLGFVNKSTTLNYTDFLRAFEEGRADKYEPAQADVQHYRHHDDLSPEKAEARLKRYITDQCAALTAIFQAIDKENSGKVSEEEFRRVLNSFCFKMTDPQFKYLVNKLRSSGSGDVSYPAFLDAYQSGTNAENMTFNDRMLGDVKSPVDNDTFLQSLSKAVHSKFYHMARHFAEIDYAKIGVVSREDFYDVVSKHCFKMSQSQFDSLWATLKVNQFGNADYRDFLKVHSSGQAPTAEITQARPGTRQGVERELMFSRAASRPGTRAMSRAASVAASRQGAITPMVNAQSVEQKIQNSIQKQWRRIQEQCKLYDVDNTGEIEVSQFKEIVDRFKLDVDLSDFHTLITKYDINNNGRFSYVNFLKNFVLSMNSRVPDITERRSIPDSRLPTPAFRDNVPSREKTSPGLTSDQFYEAMLRIRDTVINHWKDMRRQFRRHDPTGSGVVSPFHFRNTLRAFQLNLSEDEFYHMMTYYDKGMTGNISYNDFIAHFLKAVN